MLFRSFGTTILVPARNEASTILHCLKSIKINDLLHLKTNVIVINDHSEDSTAEVVKKYMEENPEFPLTLISLSNNFHKKKGAITEGTALAEGEYIILRDADTTSGENWLESIISHLQKNKPDLLIAPVEMINGKKTIEKFQYIENIFLQQFTAGMALLGSPVLCNGANLAFKKVSFNAVNGYEGNLNRSSGDDIFLMEKFRRKKNFTIQYHKSIPGKVNIKPIPNFKALLHQKLRWAGKFSFRTNVLASTSVIITIVLNLILLGWLFISFFNTKKFLFAIIFFLLKLFIDSVIISELRFSGKFFREISNLVWLEFLNLFYIPMVVLSSLFLKPYWKGRKVT
mgnify:FL=1